jgi:hypothetical protein
VTAIDTSTAAVTALMDGVTKGPWAYRPHKYDDWGVVRASDFHLCQARAPERCSKDELSKARELGIDPWEANARFIAAARQLVPALLAERDAALVGAVKVKPLVWFEVEKSRYGGKYTADGYTIRYIEGLWLLDFAGQSKAIWRFPTIEAAKAAAQTDYEARILAAIQPDPDARQADLAKAFCMGRDTCGNAMDDVADNWSCGHMPPHCDCARDIEQWRLASDECRALLPPADLAAKIGGEE